MRRPITSRMHAMLDYPLAVVLIATPWIFGFVLAVSPFVLGFSDEGTNAWLPLVVAGVGMLNAGLLTQRSPETPG